MLWPWGQRSELWAAMCLVTRPLVEEQSGCLHEACLALAGSNENPWVVARGFQTTACIFYLILFGKKKNEMVKYFRYAEKCRDLTKTLARVTLPPPFLHISGVPFLMPLMTDVLSTVEDVYVLRWIYHTSVPGTF